MRRRPRSLTERTRHTNSRVLISDAKLHCSEVQKCLRSYEFRLAPDVFEVVLVGWSRSWVLQVLPRASHCPRCSGGAALLATGAALHALLPPGVRRVSERGTGWRKVARALGTLQVLYSVIMSNFTFSRLGSLLGFLHVMQVRTIRPSAWDWSFEDDHLLRMELSTCKRSAGLLAKNLQSVSIHATQAGKPRVAYPPVKRVLAYILRYNLQKNST